MTKAQHSINRQAFDVREIELKCIMLYRALRNLIASVLPLCVTFIRLSKDVEAVPLPDGKVCLLALPSECSQGDGPAGMSCLKLFSRYITDRKVRVI